MDALLLSELALQILRQALPAIEQGVKAGEISVEAQAAQMRKIDAIRAGNFTGPEWEITEPGPEPIHVAPPTAPPPGQI